MDKSFKSLSHEIAQDNLGSQVDQKQGVCVCTSNLALKGRAQNRKGDRGGTSKAGENTGAVS